MPWFPEDMETRTRDITEEMRRALVDENGWRRPKMYTRREDTDALKMFDGFEKEIESLKETRRRGGKCTRSVARIRSGWCIWRLGIRGLSIESGDGRESIESALEIQVE